MIVVVLYMLIPVTDCNDTFIFLLADNKSSNKVVATELCSRMCFEKSLPNNIEMKGCGRQGNALGPYHFDEWLRCPFSSLKEQKSDLKKKKEKGPQPLRPTKDPTRYVLQVPFKQYRIATVRVVPVVEGTPMTVSPFNIGRTDITTARFMFSQKRLYFVSKNSVYYTHLINPKPKSVKIRTNEILAVDDERQLLFTSSKRGFLYCIAIVDPVGRNKSRVYCTKKALNDLRIDSGRSMVYFCCGAYINKVSYGGQNFTHLVKAPVLMTFLYDTFRDELGYLSQGKLNLLSLTTGKTKSISLSFPLSSYPISFLRVGNQLHMAFFDALYIKFDLITRKKNPRKIRVGRRIVKVMLCGVSG